MEPLRGGHSSELCLMPTKHSDVGAAAAAIAEVSSDGGKEGTKLRVEREEVVGRLSSNSKRRSQPGHRAVSGLRRLGL